MARFAELNGDKVPDAHAVRCKLSVVTLRSGEPTPWCVRVRACVHIYACMHANACACIQRCNTCLLVSWLIACLPLGLSFLTPIPLSLQRLSFSIETKTKRPK